MIAPIDVPYKDIDLRTYSLTGWPKVGTCERCGGEVVLLVATYDRASYECRGKPANRPQRSAYSPDACLRVFKVERER